MSINELQQAIAAQVAPIREHDNLDQKHKALLVDVNLQRHEHRHTLLKLLDQQTEIINALQQVSQSLSGILLDMKLPKQVRDECAGKIQSLAESFDKELKAIARELNDEHRT